MRLEYRKALFEPAPDCAVLELATGLAMPRIVETHAGTAVFARPSAHRLGLGALHVGFEAAEPEQTGTAAFVAAHGN